MATPQYAPGTRTSWRAVSSLVLAIIGIFVIPIVLSLLAIVLGWSGIYEIDRHPQLAGKGMAIAGIIIGIIGLIIGVIGIITAARYDWIITYLY
jgi:hypothetical protein